jgi:hypothetical protein
VLLGHRRRLLKAIVELSGGAISALQADSTAPTHPSTSVEENADLTVLFCDLMVLKPARRFDPKTWVRSCGRIVAPVPSGDPLRRQRRAAPQGQGDGLFGWPRT